MTGPVGVAVVGAGTISTEYLTNLTAFPDLAVHLVADLRPQVAAAQAERFGVPASGGLQDALEHPGVEIVVNLTAPAAHAEVALAAVRAGRSVWNEKPLTLDRAGGRELLAAAEEAGVLLGCAPDTVLGAGAQTARRSIARGDIGVPSSAHTAFVGPGPERWHPNPAFLFAAGAGPLLDMGPYYVTTLVSILGPVARVAAVGTRARATRVVASGPLAGTSFPVEVPTHVEVLLEFEEGGASHSTLSADAPAERPPLVEVTGSEGLLRVPDPNRFDGTVQLLPAGGSTWIERPAEGAAHGRGLGVLDLARALRAGGVARADGELGFHVLDVLLAAEESIAEGRFAGVESTARAPELLPEGWDPGAASL